MLKFLLDSRFLHCFGEHYTGVLGVIIFPDLTSRNKNIKRSNDMCMLSSETSTCSSEPLIVTRIQHPDLTIKENDALKCASHACMLHGKKKCIVYGFI